jgi:hypothetical protein
VIATKAIPVVVLTSQRDRDIVDVTVWEFTVTLSSRRFREIHEAMARIGM